jgi:hypothetical protein
MSSSQIECPAYEAYLRMIAPSQKKCNNMMQSFLNELIPKAIEKIQDAIKKGKEKDEIVIHESKVDHLDLDLDSDDFEKIPMTSMIFSKNEQINDSLTCFLQEAFQEYVVRVVIETKYIYPEYERYYYEADIISVYIIPKSF